MIAEVATALFASIDPAVISAAGSAIQASGNLYGDLSNSLGNANTTMFTGDNQWTGTTASAAKNHVSNLSVSATQIQTGLNTIGQALVTYGGALTPFKGKTYPTPIPGSRDPEAAGDLAVVSLASVAAAADVAAGMAQMMPVANPKGTSTTTSTTGNTTLASTLPSSSALAGGSSLPGGSSATLPSSTTPGLNAVVPLASGTLSSGSSMVGAAGSENAEPTGTEPVGTEPGDVAVEDGMPVMPIGGGAGRVARQMERIRNAYAKDPDFWTDGVPAAVPGILSGAVRPPEIDPAALAEDPTAWIQELIGAANAAAR